MACGVGCSGGEAEAAAFAAGGGGDIFRSRRSNQRPSPVTELVDYTMVQTTVLTVMSMDLDGVGARLSVLR